jgi:hypothetical protein
LGLGRLARLDLVLACDFVLIPVSSVSDPISHPDPRPV